MKKIAVICDYVLRPDRIGGMDRFFVLFDTKLKEQGHIVDWYVTNYTLFNYYEKLTISSAKGKKVEQLFLDICASEKKEYNIIITHFTELCTPFYKQYHQLFLKSKIIAVDHNPRPLDGFSLKKKLKKRIAGLLYSQYIDQFIGVSKYTVHHILKDYGTLLKKKTQVIYNGIDTRVFIKRTVSKNNRFIVASHLRVSKGIQDLIKALSLIDEKYLKHVVIDVYGEGPYESNLKELTQKYNLENNIIFKGSSAKLHELFCEYNYMIQPTYMECFSLSILESLSANVPVITTTVGGNLEVVVHGENGFIYKPGDCKKLSTILKDIICGEKEIKKTTSILIEQEYYLEKMVSEHINILEL